MGTSSNLHRRLTMEWNNCKNHLPEKESLCLIHVTYGGEYGYDDFILGMPDLGEGGFACGDEMIYTRCNEWLPFNECDTIEIADLKWAYVEDINKLLINGATSSVKH